MTNSLISMRNAILGLCLLFTTQVAFAEASANDAKTIQEVGSFTEESSKMREEHIREMREVHLKHVNEMYDRKLAHNKEMTELWKQLKPGDRAGNKAIRAQIKAKHDSLKQEEKKIREDFHENVLKKRHKEFREIMKNRQKELKGKYKQ